MLFFREKELSQLASFVNHPRYKAMAIYGRRRTGKTALVLDFLENHASGHMIYFQCASFDYATCLKDFISVIVAHDSALDRLLRPYSTFRDVFTFLSTQEKCQNWVLIIDEFPFLAKKAEDTPVEFQWIIDHALGKMKLILLGSNLSFMRNQIREEQSPLYGRFDEVLEILPFTFEEVHQLFPVFEDAMDVYAQTGGVAQYVMYFRDYPSVREASESLLFQRNGRLFLEAPNLLMQEVRDITSYVVILRAIGSGEKDSGKIAKQSNMEQKNVYPYLNKLSDIDVISTVESSLSNKKERRYRISDPFFRFYYSFLEPNISLITAWGRASREVILNDQYHEFLGIVYEDIIRQNCFQYAMEGKLSFVPRSVGKWWGQIQSSGAWMESEIDVVAYDGHHLLLGECKYRSKAVGLQEYELLKLKGAFVSAKGREISYLLASRSGFTEELRNLNDPKVLLIDQV